MTITNFSATADSGYAYAQAATWTDARNAVSATATVWDDSIDFSQYSNGSWRVYHGYLVFDTSTLPVGEVVHSAELRLYVTQDDGSGLVVQDGQPIYPSVPPVDGDFDITQYGILKALDAGPFLVDDYNDITVSDVSLITVNGITKMLVRGGDDFNNLDTDPSGGVIAGPSALNPPILVVNHRPPASGIFSQSVHEVSSTGSSPKYKDNRLLR